MCENGIVYTIIVVSLRASDLEKLRRQLPNKMVKNRFSTSRFMPEDDEPNKLRAGREICLMFEYKETPDAEVPIQPTKTDLTPVQVPPPAILPTGEDANEDIYDFPGILQQPNDPPSKEEQVQDQLSEKQQEPANQVQIPKETETKPIEKQPPSPNRPTTTSSTAPKLNQMLGSMFLNPFMMYYYSMMSNPPAGMPNMGGAGRSESSESSAKNKKSKNRRSSRSRSKSDRKRKHHKRKREHSRRDKSRERDRSRDKKRKS